MDNAIGKALTAGYRARAALARALYPEAAPANEFSKALRRDGIVVLPGLLAGPALETIQGLNSGRFDFARAAELLLSPDGKAIVEAASVSREDFDKYYFLHIKNYHERLDIYRAVDPAIAPILRAYYRSRYYYRDLVCYRSQPVPEAYAGSYAWHRDNYPPGCLKVMVYLTDVLGEASGPLVYALGTQTGFAPELGRYGPRIPREEIEGRRELQPALGPAGTVIIFDNNGVHRASQPSDAHREVLNATIFPSVTSLRPAVQGLDLEIEKKFLKRYTR